MKEAIYQLSENDKVFLLHFQPEESKGYSWDQNQTYNQIKHILDQITNKDGHSGASFSICLRNAIQDIKQFEDYDIIQADEIQEHGHEHMITLEPIPTDI